MLLFPVGFFKQISESGTLIIDKLTTKPLGAWSTRKLKSGYTGNAISVTLENESYSTPHDVGFDETGELNSLPSLNNLPARLSKFYDQSGHNNHLTGGYESESLDIISPQIHDGTNIQTINGYPCVKGVEDQSTIYFTIPKTQPFTISWVIQFPTAFTTTGGTLLRAIVNPSDHPIVSGGDFIAVYESGAGGKSIEYSIGTYGKTMLLTVIFDGINTKLRINKTEVGSGDIGNFPLTSDPMAFYTNASNIALKWAEGFVFGTALNSTDLDILENDLYERYISINYNYLLDQLSVNPIAAWATRKLSSTYYGFPLAIPADIGNWNYSGDITLNTFTDIGFDGVEIDTTQIPLSEDVDKKIAAAIYYDQTENYHTIWSPYAPSGPFLREPDGSLNSVNGKQVCISDMDTNGLSLDPFTPINCKTMIYAVKANFAAWAIPNLEGESFLYKFEVVYDNDTDETFIKFNNTDNISFTSGLQTYVITIQYFSDTNSLSLRINGVEVVNSSPQLSQFAFDGYFSLYNGQGQNLPNTRVTFGEMYLFNSILSGSDLNIIEQDLIARYS